jgi:hypothetical protein
MLALKAVLVSAACAVGIEQESEGVAGVCAVNWRTVLCISWMHLPLAG